MKLSFPIIFLTTSTLFYSALTVQAYDGPPPTACTSDVYDCGNGSLVGRDPNNSCDFFPCPANPLEPEPPVVTPERPVYPPEPEPPIITPGTPLLPIRGCSGDLFQCPDGSFVPRDPDNDWSFEPCPRLPPIACPRDTKTCPYFNVVVSRVPELFCDFAPCPVPTTTEEGIPLPLVEASPADDEGTPLVIEPQPTESESLSIVPPPNSGGLFSDLCPTDSMLCPDGTVLRRNPLLGCSFQPCPRPSGPPLCPPQKVCLRDTRTCRNGSLVFRNPNNNCEFDRCEPEPPLIEDPVICPQDMFTCPDGSVIARDPMNQCAFPDCPNRRNLRGGAKN